MPKSKIKSLKDVVNSREIDILDEPLLLFHPVRILIMKTLARHGQAEFRDLKHSLGITDGNLSSNIRSLELKGYVTIHKEIIGRKIRTSFELTDSGMKAFEDFTSKLKEVIGK